MCIFLQGAGGLDYMISMAEKILRKKPSAITFLGPLVSYIFTVICGTSYVAFSVYPVIAEIAINEKFVQNVLCLCQLLHLIWQFVLALQVQLLRL